MRAGVRINQQVQWSSPMIKPSLLSAALTLTLVAPVVAQDRPELSYGINITSNYINKGLTQSNDNPALQGYVEAAYGMFYGGVWSSTVDFPGDPEFGDDNLEFDLYAGVRHAFGDLSVDVSYLRYLYDDSGDCCGEFVLGASYPIADLGELNAEFDYDPVGDTRWLQMGAALDLPAEFSIGGTVGTDFGSMQLGEDDQVAWDVGLTRGLGDFAAVDLRYYHSTYEDGTAVLSIGIDF
jgi:uncharacterized protein (TIGR02001 family)